MRNFTVSVVLTLFLLYFQGLSAQIPEIISYQGLLSDSEGNPVENGSYDLTFRLFEAQNAGEAVWSESQSVFIINGIFNVLLGSVTDLSIPFDRQYWLGISVENGDELEPRIPLTSTAYSFVAHTVPDGSITALKLADESVTQEKLHPDISLPLSGDAGGDLTGVYPDPELADEVVTSSKLADGAVTTAKLADKAVTPPKISEIPAASVTIANNINVNSTASIVVPFESKNFDIGNIHNTATNNTRLVAPIDGIYQISAMVTWSDNNTGIRQISVRRNNVTRMGDTRTAVGFTSQSLSGLLQLNKDDFVDLLVFQDSGTTLQLISGAPIKFEMFWVAPSP